MKKLRLDMDQVTFVMEIHDNLDSLNLLDTETGEILNVYRGLILALEEVKAGAELELPPWQKDVVEKTKRILAEGNGRYQEIPRQGLNEAYQIMVEFARSTPHTQLQGELHAVLNNGAAFRGFIQTIMKYPEEYNRWFAFSDKKMKEQALEWLSSLGIDPIFKSETIREG